LAQTLTGEHKRDVERAAPHHRPLDRPVVGPVGEHRRQAQQGEGTAQLERLEKQQDGPGPGRLGVRAEMGGVGATDGEPTRGHQPDGEQSARPPVAGPGRQREGSSGQEGQGLRHPVADLDQMTGRQPDHRCDRQQHQPGRHQQPVDDPRRHVNQCAPVPGRVASGLPPHSSGFPHPSTTSSLEDYPVHPPFRRF
jgi:hypothetical protein